MHTPRDKPIQPTLTQRQLEVLRLLAEGRSARETGERLHISARTVEFHKYKIMGKLCIKSSAELIRYAVKQGIVSP